MSSKASKKVAYTAKTSQPVVKRIKLAAQKQKGRNKEKKTEKPELNKPEIKSPKRDKSAVQSKDALLKKLIKKPEAEIIEQVEYYPDKLKRDISTKKIMLKPKHNFKVIASTNKRKLAIPHKGLKSPQPSKKQKSFRNTFISPIRCKSNSPESPEMSVTDMVRLMEENGSLSDEDFMEILTCPSPVWWEDPPDGRYIEDSIYTRSPEPPPELTNADGNKKQIRTNSTKYNMNNNLTKEHKTDPLNKKNDKFVKKQLKLENILGNIKNKTIKKKADDKDEVKNNEMIRNRKISESTEGDFSDMSFNEEEILKNLENMDIPIEKPTSVLIEDDISIKKEIDDLEIKKELITLNENVDMQKLSSLNIKREIKEEISVKSPVSDVQNIDIRGQNSNTDKTSKQMVVDNCKKANSHKNSFSFVDVDSLNNDNVNKFAIEQNETNILDPVNTNNCFPDKKPSNDLTEYITVYKIIPEKNSLETNIKPTDNTNKTKLENVRGKLNNFFKQCKSSKRLKKTGSPIPSVQKADVKAAINNEKENDVTTIDLVDEKNRLNPCEVCAEKVENGITDFACDKCELSPILPCYTCNFLADTKEVYRKHISSCKNVASHRITWSHNLVLNQT